ncbi:hypothetical protein [Streptomyces sp. JB150]|uniref:hypothetical protein n=1 Tax=Streptomyces sp. JB150 TaxID=2714844 RepID=UPI0014097F07|nr:hypothetical protein [Streptomyces sp. JB150]QIJ62604.1 hypothetical protein G7Z13_11555 [Streptomyces sp. JB150]
MTARTLDYRGSVVPSSYPWGETRARLISLAEQFPVGSRIVHACGREGTVALDQPDHVPGMFNGRPTAVCLGGEWHDTPMVFATWDNEYDLVWRVWVPVAKIRRGSAPAVNRPGNKARIGGRR